MTAVLAVLALAIVVYLFAKLVRPGDRQLAFAKRVLVEVEQGRLHIEPIDVRSAPMACHPAADQFVVCGFSVMGAIATRKQRLPDSYSILLLDGNASTYARATAVTTSAQASCGLSEVVTRAGRCRCRCRGWS